jgi:glycosyltransferase involved in cell wall biosynthesis
MRAFALHDLIVARRVRQLASQIDIVHAWPLGSLQTLAAAASLGIPTVLERPNAHTRFAYEVVRRECEKLGVRLPPDHEHAYNHDVLDLEEAEYRLATRLLCPSDFVARTFADEGFAPDRLARHQYGFDEQIYRPDAPYAPRKTLTMLFVGGCAPRKGLHYALEAWVRSKACTGGGRFQIAGEFVPGYAQRLSSLLSHPSVEVLGHRTDVDSLMRQSDLLVLPSIEEGSALVTSEARGSGCVLLVSSAAGAVCKHGHDSLVHRVGDVEALAGHLDMLHADRGLLRRLRERSLAGTPGLTWTAAGVRLLDVYRETLDLCRPRVVDGSRDSAAPVEAGVLEHARPAL